MPPVEQVRSAILVLPRFIGLEGLWWAGPISDATSTVLTVVALAIQLRALPRTR
jgi:hypothetical protein